ncbi:MAG: crosslink repair DNA glycosylase YcaQ family protein [Anaerolineae bacterium]
MKTLSQDAVRGLMIAAQGLHLRPAAPATKADLRQMIRQMHAFQIDTIHVVARSPYLVLWSRVGEYPQRWLDDLLAEGALFEYWSHAACFLPIDDYPLYWRHAGTPHLERAALASVDGSPRRAGRRLLTHIRE